MNREGPPAAPEKKEKEPITDQQCVEAMKAENFELVRNWYDQEQKKTESQGAEARVDLTIRMASLQADAGLREYVLETIDQIDQSGAPLTPEQNEAIQQIIDRLG